ncbi:LysM peptidoglycan-binding domain-containing protein [Daejeonella oryzae]|uniref:LysM peptidoglycan-binding domain-containing protein n=1 Tax=Daejeonella oryzae TaxID=1122943 RepID=UPI0004008720|nr:LysM peptidoglycan-binding domain-containing protein [Daejeonella oryzae]
MALQEKYSEVISLAKSNGINDLKVNEQNNILYVSGTAGSEEVKRKIWDSYQRLDPDMRSGDMVLDIAVIPQFGQQTYTVKSGDSLSKIASNYDKLSWQEIFEANKDTISNPDLIHPGQVLKIPSK